MKTTKTFALLSKRAAAVGSLLTIAMLLPSAGPALADPPDPFGGTGGAALGGTLTVRVVAAGTTDPVGGAFVMVGPGQDDPFPGNVGFTDGSGEIVFSDPSLTGLTTVTAGGAGRAYVTLFDVGVSELVLPLQAIEPGPSARLGDQFLGIEVNNGFLCAGDGNLDVGFVLPALPVDRVLNPAALINLFLPTVDEPLSTPLGDVNVPSNLYMPNQCELFGFYNKLAYHLRVPTGRQTLFGLSARGALGTFLDLANAELNAETIIQLLNDVDFRELDVLRDLDVAGDSDDADLSANLGLSENLTLEVSNAQTQTAVFAATGGRLTTPGGGEELLLTGLGGFDPDQTGPSATVNLTTRQAGGELSDLVHGALVTQLRDGEDLGNEGATTAFVRSGFTPPATLAFGSFFEIVEVDSPDDVTFSWTDVRSATSPATRDVNRSQVIYQKPGPNPDDPADEITELRTYWVLYTLGADQDLVLPALPPAAPTAFPDTAATAEPDSFFFSHEVFLLGDDPDGFSYDAFALADAANFGTHVSTNNRALRCGTSTEIVGLAATKGPGAGEVSLTWSPSPDVCHDTVSGRGYEVYAGDDPRPVADPGAWPSDPVFLKITDDELDGSLADETFTHLPSAGSLYYIVVDRGQTGNEGPAGHYGSFPPTP